MIDPTHSQQLGNPLRKPVLQHVDKLVKIGAKLVTHARYAVFQMAEVAVPRDLFRRILANIADLRCRAPTPC